MATCDLTAARARELLHYDPATGVFTRLKSRIGRVIGCRADVPATEGYRRVCIGADQYAAHRLAVFMQSGEWPALQVDHINGLRSDNRWANLRVVTASENSQNVQGASSKNRAGLLGVATRKDCYEAQITTAGVRLCLGRFKSPEEAHEVYMAAKRRLHSGCTI